MSILRELGAALPVPVTIRSGSTVAEIQAEIDALSAAGGGPLFIEPGTYTLTATLVPKRRVVICADFGAVIFRLGDGVNAPLVESFKFATFYAGSVYQDSQDADMTLDYGFSGIIFDGNGENQTGKHTCVKLYGRRLVFENCIVANSSGIGLWTALKGVHTGAYDFTKTRTPGRIENIEIVGCVEEGWVFEGPADQHIGYFVINAIGDVNNDGTTPQTSTMFPDEEVHGVRVQDAMHIESCNLNGVRFGRCLYVAPNTRITAGDIICAGGWGNALFAAGALGNINSLRVQANQRIWGGVAHPSIDMRADDVQISIVEALRVAGLDQPSVPLIHDTGGCSWGLVQNRQALAEGGVFFLADANTVTIAQLNVVAAGVAIQTTNACFSLNIRCQFLNCNLVWDNDRTNIIGNWDFSGSLSSATQAFGTGVDNWAASASAQARVNYLDLTTSNIVVVGGPA